MTLCVIHNNADPKLEEADGCNQSRWHIDYINNEEIDNKIVSPIIFAAEPLNDRGKSNTSVNHY